MSDNKLVLSVAGHDKGRLYAVLEKNEASVLVADGKRRKLSAPKRKNLKHVIFLPDLGDNDSGIKVAQITDAALRRVLAQECSRRLPVFDNTGLTSFIPGCRLKDVGKNESISEKTEKDQGGTNIG